MCPSAPESVPVDINIHSTDEELVQFLEGRKVGDPTPNNVITDLNPFNVEPWNSPEDTWYLHNSEGPRSPKQECEIKETRSGYWRPTEDLRIFTSTCASGRKKTLEFFKGKAPFGERTGWMMHEYQADKHTLNEYNSSKDYSSLCRVFLQTDRNPSQREQYYSASAGNSDGQFVERVLLNFLEQEERDLCSRDSAHGSQTVAEKDQGQSALSSRRPDEPVPENSAANVYGSYDFSNEEYLELNDLCSPETLSASSDKSSLMSINSDEFFDPDALLRYIENDHGLGVEEEHTNYRFSICAPSKSNQVVIRPPPPGTINSNGDLMVEERNPAGRLVRNGLTSGQGHSLSTNELQQNGKASIASRSQGNQANQANQIADTSHQSRTSKGNALNSVQRIAKMGKKCCCFGPF